MRNKDRHSRSGGFSHWKVMGTAGGDNAILLDPIRGPLNEGGLTAERLGWHLPGFDDSDWPTSSPSSPTSAETNGTASAAATGAAGVKFYRTVVPLHVPRGLDAYISFTLTAPAGSKIRAQLFVNGYQYGRFVPWVGNQVEFPVPAGVLDYDGDNTIGLSVWRQSADGDAGVEVGWRVTGVVESGFSPLFEGGYLRPGWSRERLAWA